MITSASPRGFTLLVAVVLCSVLVSVALALFDISYKQVLLAAAATQSQYAFYNADSALECGLYWDQKQNAFDYSAPLPAASLTCNNQGVTSYVTSQSGGVRTTSFTTTCASGTGSSASITVTKSSTNSTSVYANGYNSCDSTDSRRIERSLKAIYAGN
jgi:Tfp pilus assembly protein PilX